MLAMPCDRCHERIHDCKCQCDRCDKSIYDCKCQPIEEIEAPLVFEGPSIFERLKPMELKPSEGRYKPKLTCNGCKQEFDIDQFPVNKVPICSECVTKFTENNRLEFENRFEKPFENPKPSMGMLAQKKRR